MATSTLTNRGRAVLARALSLLPLHLGWGTGDPAWDELAESELPSLVNATALTSEIGRRKVSSVSFVEQDDAGDIVIPVEVRPSGEVEVVRYKRVQDITPNLYISVSYDHADAANATIREVALFAETETAAGLPPGQLYFTPDEIASPGNIIAAQILKPVLLRSPSNREIMEFVLPI